MVFIKTLKILSQPEYCQFHFHSPRGQPLKCLAVTHQNFLLSRASERLLSAHPGLDKYCWSLELFTIHVIIKHYWSKAINIISTYVELMFTCKKNVQTLYNIE